MLSIAVWLLPLALECLVLVRGFQENLLKSYRFFYAYLAFVVLRDASLMTIYFLWPRIYGYAYWYCELFLVVIGCGVVWEVYREALCRYPGAARMVRNVLGFVLIFTFSRLLVKAWNSSNWIPGRTTLETERDLRIVQMALLLGLITLFSYYAIPLKRGLKGIIYGFVGFVAVTLIHLTFGEYLRGGFQHIWPYVQPVAYVLVLLTWCVTLWSFEATTEMESDTRLEADYLSLAAVTRKQLRTARNRLSRVVRP